MIRISALAALLIVLFGAGAVWGQAQRRVVLLVRGEPRDVVGVELLARIRGELRAARFDLGAAAPPASGAAREVVEREAQRPGVAVAMGVFFDGDQPEVWVSDARSGRTTVESLFDPAGGQRRPSVLAANAVDLIKAALADVLVEEPRSPPMSARPPAPPIAALPARPAAPHDTTVLAGAGWLRAGGSQTVAPTLSVAVRRGHLGARLAASGWGSSTEVAAPAAGTARISQSLALLELLACARFRPAAFACAAAGGGAQLLRTAGAGAAGFEGTSSTLGAGVASAGATLAWMPGRWLAIGADARAVGAWPSTNIQIGGQTVGHAGGLGVWLTAGVGARL